MTNHTERLLSDDDRLLTGIRYLAGEKVQSKHSSKIAATCILGELWGLSVLEAKCKAESLHAKASSTDTL